MKTKVLQSLLKKRKRAISWVLFAAVSVGSLSTYSTNVRAETDISTEEKIWEDTELVENGSFEETNEDGTIAGWLSATETQPNHNSWAKSGSYSLGLWAEDAYITDVYQEIELTAGTYKLSAYYVKSEPEEVGSIYVKQNDETLAEARLTSLICDWNDLAEAEFTLEADATVTLGVYADATAGYWQAVDDMKLYRMDTGNTDEEGDGSPGEGDSSSEVYIWQDSELVENGGFESLNVDGTIAGWSYADTEPNSNSWARSGSRSLGFWAEEAYVSDVYQEINLPAGIYKLSAYYVKSEPVDVGSIYVKLDDNTIVETGLTSLVCDWSDLAEAEFTLETDATVTIGIYADATAGYWQAVDDVKLYRWDVKEVDEEEELLPNFVKNGSFEEAELQNDNNYSHPEWIIADTTTEGSLYVMKDAQEAKNGVYMLSAKSDTPYQAEVYQTIEGLEPGYYYLTAYTQKGKGNLGNEDQNVCYLYGNGSAQSKCMTAIPRRGVVSKQYEWTLITVRGIEVGEDGKAVIGLYMDANAGNWLNMDNVKLHREKNQEQQYQLLKGGDLSISTLVESKGGKYYDENGVEGDVYQILSDVGFNIARLRLYNNPGKGRGTGGYYCPDGSMNPKDILKQAIRAKEKGMQIELSFHYSDYWTNGGTQIIPSDWQKEIEGLSAEEAVDKLEELVYEFTKDFMEKMKAQDTTPEYVSIGNEMQGGLLYPYGKSTDDLFPNLARFLNAGYRAVKEVSPNTRVILHSDDAGSVAKYNSFFDNCGKFGVNYDIIGASYYPYYTGKEVSEIVDWCNDLVDRYDKDIMIMETGFSHTAVMPDGSGATNNGPYAFGEGVCSPANQREFLYELYNGLKSVKDGRCIGDLYWDPIWVKQEGAATLKEETDDAPGDNGTSHQALFDFNHKLMTAADAFRYNQEGGQTGYISGKIVSIDGAAATDMTVTITLNGNNYNIHTDSYGTFHMELSAGDYTVEQVSTSGMIWNGEKKNFTVQGGVFSSLYLVLSGGNLTGTVVDQDGKPVANAKVTVSGENGTHETTTDTDGKYSFGNIPVVASSLTAEKFGYQLDAEKIVELKLSETIDADNLKLNIVAGSAHGVVTGSDGQPIEDVHVKVTDGTNYYHFYTDADGKYELSTLLSGIQYTVTYKKEGYAQETMPVEVVVKEEKNLGSIILKRAIGSVQTSVLDVQGNPVEEALVKLTTGEWGYTDVDGKINFEEVAIGANQMSVSKEGYVGRDIEFTVLIETALEQKVVLGDPITIINPSFNTTGDENYDGDLGWILSAADGSETVGTYFETRAATTQCDGTDTLSFWASSPFKADAHQKVNDLKAGQYVFRIQAYTGMSHNDFANSDFYMYVKDAEGNLLAKQDIPNSGWYTPCELIFTLPVDGNCIVGFYADAASGDWAVLDVAELGYCGQASEMDTPDDSQNPDDSQTPDDSQNKKQETNESDSENANVSISSPNTGDDSYSIYLMGILCFLTTIVMSTIAIRKKYMLK